MFITSAESSKPWPRHDQAKDRLNRKAAILLEILNAGTALEAKIRQHRDEIDELMLQMLFKRIEASQRCVNNIVYYPQNPEGM